MKKKAEEQERDIDRNLDKDKEKLGCSIHFMKIQ